MPSELFRGRGRPPGDRARIVSLEGRAKSAVPHTVTPRTRTPSPRSDSDSESAGAFGVTPSPL